jgi:serine/threonine-protein kinase
LHRFVDRSLFGIGLDYAVVDRTLLEADALRRRLEEHELLRGYTGWQLVGGGGRSSVFRAEHPGRGRPVAIKVLRVGAEDGGGAERFDREADIVAGLDHPNIVRMFGHSNAGGLRIMVMDYVSDRDLAQLLPAGGLPYEHALQLLADLCSALEYAHRAGIVHRDIKPSNILLRRVFDESVRFRAVLTDFGIAKLPEEATEITRTSLLGTVAYMSPEQIRNPSRVDVRSDIYSLGAVAYQMFTGTVPFKAPNATAVLLAHLQQPPVDPRVLRPDLPDWTAIAILRALAKRHSDRWPSAMAFLEALRNPQQRIAGGS